VRERETMKDFLFVVVVLIFFLLSAAYVRGCERL
jgi:preprotein translocase subunit SecE